ncbi:hypothetical protein KI387_026866 [Taxus chinensis]|uniref:Uncharacterized protein n=1 Tax=Taxus chinensis TaxID=29808 RepID=A0AA38FWZ5_TAXCH|nr:hypothetical protein KI387_026866 [Taxus chinensis]
METLQRSPAWQRSPRTVAPDPVYILDSRTEAGRVRADTPREGTQADGATTGRATSLPSVQEG